MYVCVYGGVCVYVYVCMCVYKILFFLIFSNSIDKSIGSKYYKRECLLSSKTKMKDFIRLWLAKGLIIQGKPFYIHHTSDLSKSKEETRKFEFRNIFARFYYSDCVVYSSPIHRGIHHDKSFCSDKLMTYILC